MATWNDLSIEMQQTIISFTGSEYIYKKMYGENVPKSMQRNIEMTHFSDLAKQKKYILFCKYIKKNGKNRENLVNLFILCFKNKSWENSIYIYFCFLSQDERIKIKSKIKPELEDLKNYVINDMKLIMHKTYDALRIYRYNMIFQSEQDLICTFLVSEFCKIDQDYDEFLIPFGRKTIIKKWTHTDSPHIHLCRDTISSCSLWNVPLILGTDRSHEMFKTVYKKFSSRCFCGCLYCHFSKIFALHILRFKNFELFKLFRRENII